MAALEIPLTPQAQRFSISFGGTVYRMRLLWNDADEGGWTLDIGDEDGTLLVAGIPLVTGVDLLAQHRHLGFAGGLYVTTDRGAGEVPTYLGLGQTAHLFYVTTA